MRLFRRQFLLATRLTAAFVLVAAITGSIAGLVFARTLLLGLDDGLDVGLRSRAQTLQAQLGGVQSFGAVTGTSGITQVLSPSGVVLASSAAAGSRPLFAPDALARARRGDFIIDADRELPASAGSRPEAVSVRLLGAPLRGGDIVIVGNLRDTVNEAVNETVTHLFVAGVIGLLFVGIGARLLIGAALRPVETARRQVELAAEDATAPVLVDPGGVDEFSRLVRTFNHLLRRQHELLEAERTFTADAGHELRTPLAILSGELELAARPARTRAEVTEALGIAKDETDRLVRLTEQLLLLARSDVHTLVSRRPGDVTEVVRTAVVATRLLAQRAGVTVTVDAPEHVSDSFDPDRLRLAIDNLLRNAIRHAPTGSTVTVTLTDGPTWHLRVADTGPGFAPEFLPHAFDRFRRDDAARGRDHGRDNGHDNGRDNEHGAGLGLAIVKAVVTAHGGTVQAANDGGAVVGFEIPRGAEHV